MSAINIKLYETFRKELNLSEEKSKALVLAIQDAIHEDVLNATNEYKSFWKDDFHTLDKRIIESKNDMYKALFITSVVQLIAILGGVLAIVKFVMNK
jgi:hypothetical protein